MTAKSSKNPDDNLDVPISQVVDHSHLQLITALSPVVTYTCRPDGDFGATFISENIRNYLGYEPSEFVENSRFWSSKVHPDDKPEVIERLQKLGESETQEHEYRFLHKDGTYRWVHDKIRVLKTQNGKPLELVGSFMDITERRTMEKSLRDSQTRLEIAQEMAKLGCWEWDIVNDESWCSDGAYRIYGFDRKTFDGSYKSFLAYVHPEDSGLVEEEIQRTLTEGTPYAIDYRVIRPDGSVRHISSQGQLTFDSERRPVRLVGTALDITARKNLEEALFKAKKLEIIGQVTAGVAHEVRNPLNAILSISEALFKEEEFSGKLEYQEYLYHIRVQVNRLSKLMSDLLDLGKPINDSKIQPLSLTRLCTEYINLWKMSNLTEEHPVAFSAEPHVRSSMVKVEAKRLQQILHNLLDNAAHSSPEKSEIQVSIIAMDKNKVAIQVKDSGKGVPPDKIGRVFDPFFSLRQKGTGLGLTLVKHFVENMGGTIQIRNNKPHPGCTAELILNIAER